MNFTGTGNFFRQDIQPILALEVILFILAAISLLMNGLLMYLTIVRERKRHALDTILLCLIAFLDLSLSLVVLCSQTWKWATAYQVVVDNSLWCHLNSILSWSISVSALNVVGLLSFVRYLVIVRGHKLKNSHWALFALALVIFIFGLFIAKDLTSRPMVFPSTMFCASVWPGEQSNLSVFFESAMIITAAPPLIAIPLFYSSVTSHYRLLISRLGPTHQSHHLNRRAYGFILVVTVYVIVLLPEYLQAFISIIFKIRVVSWVDSIIKVLMFSVSIVNALFAMLFHEEIYLELRHFLDRNHILLIG